VSHLRDERRFDTTEALVQQMTDDVTAAREALGLIPDRPGA
jgi:FAD synthase